MNTTTVTNQAINSKFELFARQIMLLRLINSGKSNLSDKQSEIVAGAFASAYEIIKLAKKHRDTDLLKRVYNMTYELVPTSEMMEVMQHPQMYKEMLNAQLEFNNKIIALLKNRRTGR